jgi:hypothetical protein
MSREKGVSDRPYEMLERYISHLMIVEGNLVPNVSLYKSLLNAITTKFMNGFMEFSIWENGGGTRSCQHDNSAFYEWPRDNASETSNLLRTQSPYRFKSAALLKSTNRQAVLGYTFTWFSRDE